MQSVVVPAQWVQGTLVFYSHSSVLSVRCLPSGCKELPYVPVFYSHSSVLNETVCISKLEIALNKQRQLVIMREDLKAHSLVAAPKPYTCLHLEKCSTSSR